MVVKCGCNCNDELLRILVLPVSQPESKSGLIETRFSGIHYGAMLGSSVVRETARECHGSVGQAWLLDLTIRVMITVKLFYV